MGGDRLHRDGSRIAEAGSAVCGIVGVEHGDIPSVRRHAHPVVLIGVGREVHRAQEVAALLVLPQEHHHVVVVVIRHQPLEAAPVEVDLPQGRVLFVEGVDVPEEPVDLPVQGLVQQIPVQLSVGVPLVPLTDLRPMKRSFFPGWARR